MSKIQSKIKVSRRNAICYARESLSGILSQIQSQIKFSRRNAIYYAGESLAGILCLLNVSDIISEIKSIDVLVLGLVQNYWINKNSDKIYEREENCLKKVVHLVPSNPNSINMVTGAHNYSFDVDLPENLPSSFDGVYGQISYSIGVQVMDTNDKVHVVYEKPITVMSSVHLSKHPTTMQPVEAVDTTDYSCCSCFPFGTVRTVITIPKNGFVPNESIVINAVVYNGTRRKVTDTLIVLIQRTRFYARSRYENASDQKETCQNICQMNKGTIYPRRFLRIKNESLMVPSIIPTYDSNVISIRYVLRFTANPEIEVEIPITIGTETNVEDEKSDGLKLLQII